MRSGERCVLVGAGGVEGSRVTSCDVGAGYTIRSVVCSDTKIYITFNIFSWFLFLCIGFLWYLRFDENCVINLKKGFSIKKKVLTDCKSR